MERLINGINECNLRNEVHIKSLIKEMVLMNNIKTDTTMVKGGDGNKGFDTLKVFEAFA